MPAPAPVPAPIPAPAEVTMAAIPTAVVAEVSKRLERRSSSPIAEEEELVMADYWAWKGGQTNNINKKAQLAAAHEIVEEEMWTISQLKLMSDTSSKIFALAISKGIPSGLAAGFRADFWWFKDIYKEQYGPARMLGQLYNESMEGGFFR